MDPVIGAALVGGGIDTAAQFGGMILQNHYQKKAEKRANEEWQRRFDVENAYNLPSAQAERLRDAGVNPLAQMSGTSPTPSSSGSTNNPQAPTQQIDTDFAQLAFQARRLENETKVAEAQARNLDARTQATASEEQQNWWRIEFERARSDREERVVSMQEDLHDYNKRMASVAADIAEATKDDKISISHKELDKLDADISYVLKQGELTDQQVKDYLTVWAERSLQMELIDQNIKLTAAECSLIPQRLANMEAEELVLLSQDYLNIQQAEKAIEEAKQIVAYTAEIPANAKVERQTKKWNTYVNGTMEGIGSCASGIARVVGAIGTGGLSELTTVETTTTTSNNTMVGHYDKKGKMKGFDKTTGGTKVVTVTKKSK